MLRGFPRIRWFAIADVATLLDLHVWLPSSCSSSRCRSRCRCCSRRRCVGPQVAGERLALLGPPQRLLLLLKRGGQVA